MGRIGIGVTCHGRNEYLKAWLEKMGPLLPPACKLVIVDDASPIPIDGATFRFEKNAGVAAAKNKCLELLEYYEHIFLFDDDTYPIAPNWWEPYINTGQPHLMYIFENFSTGKKLNDTAKVYQDDKIVAYSHARGCMLYVHSSVLAHVGGMNTDFGKWGYEHPDWSNRIYNAGLTQFRYMDVPGSNKLIYSMDEHQLSFSTCKGMERRMQIAKNKPVYEHKYYQREYVPYKEGAVEVTPSREGNAVNMVLTCHYSRYPDPQGREWEQTLKTVYKLYRSLLSFDAIACTFWDHGWPIKGLEDFEDQPSDFEESTCYINPYFQRWVTYRDYLIKHRRELKFIWCVDATDVEMLRDPFPEMEEGVLYVGDEPDTLASVWLNKHHRHPKLLKKFQYFAKRPLLNAGLVGGDIETMIAFTGLMIDTYQECEHDAKLKGIPGAGLTDMGVLNYVADERFFKLVSHGPHVNTKFKAYETDNKIAWWKHK